MAQVRRRKGNRQPVRVPTPIVVFVYEKRIEGNVVDTSPNGVGVLLPANTGLSEQQAVKILYQRQRKSAKVVRVEPTEEGDRVGLKIMG